MDPFEKKAKFDQKQLFNQVAVCSKSANNIVSEVKNTESPLYKLILRKIGNQTSAYFGIPLEEIPQNIRSDVKKFNSCYYDNKLFPSKYLILNNNYRSGEFAAEYIPGLYIIYNCKGNN